MKNAVSIPDEILEAAEAVARRTGITRNQLVAEAVKHFLEQHDDSGITERLDAVYRNVESSVDPVLAELQLSAIHSRDPR